MIKPKYLIDTNVFIKLEDNAEVSPGFSALSALAYRHGISLCIHEAARDDICRDKNVSRRAVSLSKIEKFEIIDKTDHVDESYLNSRYGNIGKHNDLVDATLLDALDMGIVDFLITEDQALHNRATKVSSSFGKRVLYVADAVSLLRSNYEPISVSLPAVVERSAHSVDRRDPIFQSLKEDYPEFENWWRDKCVKPMRKCWVVMEEGHISGIIVRKDEASDDTDACLPGSKFLKICTFKVREESRGIKLGELLLKQVFWYAQTNNYDVVYLSAYPKQATLIELLKYYGFECTRTNPSGEGFYEKKFSTNKVAHSDGECLFDVARLNYPRFACGAEVPSYVVPIREQYHEILFPELVAPRNQLNLFSDNDVHRPGNTIRKVYLSRATVRIPISGSILFFYKSKSKCHPSQSITTIGIYEDSAYAESIVSLRQLAGGRSVYSNEQLAAFAPTKESPVRVINFLLSCHFTDPVPINELLQKGVFSGSASQSIKTLTEENKSFLLSKCSTVAFTI